jgi:MATE family multidrug resistance protein
LGVIPLSVHTVPTQVITVLFMIPLGLGIALAVRLGVALPRSPAFARRLVGWTLAAGSALFGIVSVIIYRYRHPIFRFFVDDPLVIRGCDRIWWKVCLYYWQLALYALNMGVSIGLGMQWTLGVVTLITLWGFGLPSAWYFGVVVAKSLDVTWHFIYPPYLIMNVTLWWVFYCKDWEQVAKGIRAREGIEAAEISLSSELIRSPRRSSIYGSIEERLALVEGCSR